MWLLCRLQANIISTIRRSLSEGKIEGNGLQANIISTIRRYDTELQALQGYKPI